MSTQKTSPSNGASKETAVSNSPKNAAEQTVQEQKLQADLNPELSNFQVNAKPNSSIEERINRFLQLSKLLDRREKVTEALEDLNGFEISPTGGGLLKLTDSRGKNFAVAHPVVIGEMVHVAIQKLQDELTIIDDMFLL